jgi:hypothetical protein
MSKTFYITVYEKGTKTIRVEANSKIEAEKTFFDNGFSYDDEDVVDVVDSDCNILNVKQIRQIIRKI